MSSIDSFSKELIDYLNQTFSNPPDERANMSNRINNELFECCKKYISLLNGDFNQANELNGWSFQSGGLISLLYADQKIMLFQHSLKMKYNQSRVWKLLGLEYYSSCLYQDATLALKVALDLGLEANPNATYEILGASLIHARKEEEGKKVFQKSTRVDYNYIVQKYGGIKEYASIAFRNDALFSENLTDLFEISMVKFLNENQFPFSNTLIEYFQTFK